MASSLPAVFGPSVWPAMAKAMSPMVEALEPYTAPLEKSLLDYFNPALPYEARATKDWPMTRLSHATIAMGVYGIVVMLGVIKLLLSETPKQDNSRKPSPKSGKVELTPMKIGQIIYNISQVTLCGFMIYTAVSAAIHEGYSVIGNPFRPNHTNVAYAVWVFYLSKILDFMDTVFIVLGNKWKQFSFLHIYHHFTIFFFYWININAGYDGDIYYTVIANSFIHFVMYWYYFQTCIGNRPWWARHLTQLQMLQFLSMNAQAIYMLVTDSEYPKRITVWYLGYIISLFALFMNFYLKRYSSKSTSKPKKE